MDLTNKYASIEWIDLKNKELILTLLKPLKNIRSKIKILTYMSEWCPDCINQIYSLNKLSNDYKKYDLNRMEKYFKRKTK